MTLKQSGKQLVEHAKARIRSIPTQEAIACHSDPENLYYKDIFGSGKAFVPCCASAGRSSPATAALKVMGLPPLAHIEGGFKARRKTGGPVAEKRQSK